MMPAMAEETAPRPAEAPGAIDDFMPLDGVDHVELYVGDAGQAAYYYTRAFGFRRVAYMGLETGARDRVSHVVEQGRIRLVLTGALGSSSPIAEHHRRHGDGVKVIALTVPSAEHAYAEAVARGARSIAPPRRAHDEHGVVVLATIGAYGDTQHTFVERGAYAGPFLPAYEPVDDGTADAGMLVDIDHIVGNVERGAMEAWVGFYERVFGMTEMARFTGAAIATEYSALMSKVVADGAGRVKFPINEPAEGRRASQVDEYLSFYEGPGAQHIAVETRDIVATVAELRRRGVEFLPVPASYHDELPERVPAVAGRLDGLRENGILVDRDEEGHLLQIFTRPLGDRPTIFFELIERHGARGFGEGNFRALFEALEREQARRGNLC